MASLPEQQIESVDAEEQLALKQKYLELQKRKLQLVKDYGIAYYQPWHKQDLFHTSQARFRMLRAGNRAGKSTCGCAEDIAWMLGERPWYKKSFDVLVREGNGVIVSRRHEGGEHHPLVRQAIPQRPTKQLIITTDWDKVNEIWTGQEGARPGKFWQMVPKGFVKRTKRNHSGAIELIEGNNGSVLRFDTVESFKKNPQGSESSDWDRVHIDEPCPEGQWKAAARGLMDRGGHGDFTLTPLSEFWINDMFFPRQGSAKRASVWSDQARTYENPHLTMQNIAEYESSLTEDERECRINGIPLELSGLVYKQFSYERHVLKTVPKGWDGFNRPPSNYVIYYAIDPHPQTPHAVLFVAVAPTGQKFIFAELWVPERPIPHLAGMIHRVINGYEIGRAEVDPIAHIPHPTTERTMADDFMNAGLVLTKASKEKTYGVLNMQTVFARNDNVYVSPNLNRFLFEINRYCYDKENKPIDKDDHMMECMYRIFINEPVWYDGKNSSHAVDDIVIDRRELDLEEISLSDDDGDYLNNND